MWIEDVKLVVPVAVPFDMIEQSDPKLLKLVMLMPCSLFGVRATMQPSAVVVVLGAVVVVVALPLAATQRARTVKPLLDWPIQLSTAAPRLKLWVLVTITSTAPGVVTLGPEVGGALTATTTPLAPLVKPLRCVSYCASEVITVLDLPATRSMVPPSAASPPAL